MIYTTEMQSQVSQLNAGRDAEHAEANATRLESWKARYCYDVVEVPVPRDPPSWPALRASMPLPSNVTPIKSKKPGRG